MRIFFMAVVAILFQLCTYALASGVQWLVHPWASDAILKAVMIGLFVISMSFCCCSSQVRFASA